MPFPVRNLPIVQDWDCQQCGNCCREYEVVVTAQERQRILEQDWTSDPQIPGNALFDTKGPLWARRIVLHQQSDKSCVFLTKEGRCRIHERFGAAAKPFACRLYPFILIPAGDHWRVGMRFACPSAAANGGRPLAEHADILGAFATEQERQPGHNADRAPPQLGHGQRADWPQILHFLRAVLALLQNPEDPLERRMRKVLALASLCRQARFDKLRNGRLIEFLNLIGASLESEVASDPGSIPPPSGLGKILFRQALGLYSRKDRGPHRGLIRSRVGLLAAAVRFVRGTGPVPRLHEWMENVTFERIDEPAGPLASDAQAVLERYYVVKVNSLQFCQGTFQSYSFWEGLEALAVTLPVILWLIRAMPTSTPQLAAERAISIVDFNYGYNPILATTRQRVGVGMLAKRGDLERLIGWYSR
jgi:lysine-N-methylase